MENIERTPLVLNPPPNITRVVDDAGVDLLIEYLERTFESGFDVETTPTKDFYWRRMRTIQFGTPAEQYVIDLKAFCDDSDALYKCQGEYGKNVQQYAPRIKNLFSRLTKYLCSDKWLKVGVNLSFEYECLYWLFGIRTYGYYDCMWAEKCIYAGLGGQANLKNYSFYSMEEMFGRYFGKSIDKTLQTSFNLEDDITDAQFEYAALDTRTPLAIKAVQNLIITGETPASLKAKGKAHLAKYLLGLDKLLLGDNLTEIVDIENACLGAFVDMHVHGERLDTVKWMERTNKKKAELVEIIKKLDAFFLPIVGSKNENISDEEVSQLEVQWKSIRDVPTNDELELKLQIILKKKEVKNADDEIRSIVELELRELEIKLSQLEQARKDYKEVLKKKHSELKKKRNAINKLAASCEGDALINYSSNAQLKKVLKEHVPKLAKLESMEDEELEKYEDIPVISAIRDYHTVAKEISTYGETWTKTWVTHPCNEEGWLHPGDGRLHCEFNQYEAETGRSSSEKPNGQNLPQDKAVRSCFVADPPNENIRISDCCESEVNIDSSLNVNIYSCKNCGMICNTHVEEYVLITADMSGAELRIIADDSGDPIWISAFERNEDVHSVGTEILNPEEWPKEALPDCAYYKLNDKGEPQKKKCNCPLHKEHRDHNKAINFLLAYGGTAPTLAARLKIKLAKAKELMQKHKKAFSAIWEYLEKSGKESAMKFKSFDLFGRRRILPEPTYERAKENCKEYREKDLRLDEDEALHNVQTFEQIKGRKPNKEEEWELTHRQPTANEVSQSYFGMSGGLERQGKNHRIQGTNVTIAKLAMSAKFDYDGKPYLWHIFPKYRAKLVKFVHDELVVQAPKQHGQTVANSIGDAFKRAAATKMKKVVMEFDYNIAVYWKK
jgi:DNA polymerase I-like protein with 3'-5' exonuclease and polymerase domains